VYAAAGVTLPRRCTACALQAPDEMEPPATINEPPATASPPPLHWPVRTQLDLHQELHARPALPARSPCIVSYWVHWGMDAGHAHATLTSLCLASGAAAPAADVRHHVLQAAGYAVKFERHGEFVSWQVNRPLESGDVHEDAGALRGLLFDSQALAGLPDAFARALSTEGAGQMLAAAHVTMLRAADADDLLPRCRALVAAQAGRAGGDDAASVMGAWIGDSRRGALLTSLRLSSDGFTRFALLDFGLPHDQAAREAQRLCEIEAYRMLAMLGFPLAQREAAQLAEMERALQGAVDALASQDTHDDARAFDTLTALAAEVEHATARTRYRFSATRAYHRIVERRLADLREQRIEGVQTLSGFLGRRFAPAMEFCDSTDRRLTDIAERIGRAVGLARVRIEMHREAGNQELLKALAHRQKLQLRLQQTVEGLSVVAISYYALGLVGYLAKASKGLAPQIDPDLVAGIALLPVVAGAAWFIHRLRRHLAHD
jgi:uncharacterized membrane-anchored protein